MLQDDRDDVWVVVNNGHVERGLQSHAMGVVTQSLLGLKVGVGPLLEQLGCQTGQAAPTRCMKGTLPLYTGNGIQDVGMFKSLDLFVIHNKSIGTT